MIVFIWVVSGLLGAIVIILVINLVAPFQFLHLQWLVQAIRADSETKDFSINKVCIADMI